MALIKIKGRKDALTIPDDVARKIKQRKFGDESRGVEKALSNDLVDLGDEWSGEYGQIVSIELERKISPKTWKMINKKGDRTAYQVPLDYELKEGEEFID